MEGMSVRAAVFWVNKDFLMEENRAIDALTVILRTRGCRWRACRMCGFWHESVPSVTQDEILSQFSGALSAAFKKGLLRRDDDFMLKIFTSGSFFDDAEITDITRMRMLDMLSEFDGLRKIIVETRPEFVSEEKLNACISALNEANERCVMEVAFGLETADDFIRAKYINKGFSFEDFRNAALKVRKCGASVKVYLLLKPPFVSERAAIEDAVRSAIAVREIASTISLNLCNVQKGTFVERLWRSFMFRPPWLWSAVEAIIRIKIETEKAVISDPVGAGSRRGPHNCGKCDKNVKDAIEKFNLTQNLEHLECVRGSCTCMMIWNKLIEVDDLLFNAIPC